MALYNLQNKQLKYINESPFKLEREIQNICEENMPILLNCKFVRSEFAIDNFRLDSLTFDETASSFVIIEYKRDKNFSVIDQGYAYLSLMLNHKSDFILEYNEITGKNLKRSDVDWSQSKVIFVSPSFTLYQKEAISFKDLPIELWEIKKYSNNTVSFTQVVTKNSAESIQTISKADKTFEAVNKEIKVYTEDELVQFANENIQELYEKIKRMILNIADDITMKPTKLYIAFIRRSNFCDIEIQKNQLKVWINVEKGKLDDSKKITRDVSEVGHHGNGDYEMNISDDNDIEYLISLIRQGYNVNI
jgi:predicted transport protein